MYGEEILSIERLNPESNLYNPESDGYNLIVNTIGYWLDKLDDTDSVYQCFIMTATGKYLDLLGTIKGVYRLTDESDDDYRERIVSISNFVLSPESLRRLGADLYCYVKEIDTQITSDNLLLSRKSLIYADNDVKKIIDKYVNNRAFEYLEGL